VIFNNNQGVLVVIYDSFLVLAKPTIANKIYAQVILNCEAANVKIKYLKIADLGTSFEFCGFEIMPHRDGSKWRIAGSTVEAWHKQLNFSPEPTLRSAWSLGGVLTFADTILLQPRSSLYSFRQLQSDLGEIKEDQWDIERDDLQPYISNLVERIQNLDNSNFRSRRDTLGDRRKVIYGAFDASPEQWCFTIFPDNCVESEEIRLDLISMWTGSTEHTDPIHLTEIHAAVELLIRILPSIRGPAIIILVGDNQIALKALSSCTSRSADVLAELDRSGLKEVDYKKISVVCADIDTSENYQI
jgi:hypothetical protein